MKHLKNIEELLNKTGNIEQYTPLNMNNILNLLQFEARDVNLNKENNTISWVIDSNDEYDDNKSFTLYYDFNSGELGWEGNDIASDGEYYKPVKSTNEFEEAIENWTNDPDTWNN